MVTLPGGRSERSKGLSALASLASVHTGLCRMSARSQQCGVRVGISSGRPVSAWAVCTAVGRCTSLASVWLYRMVIVCSQSGGMGMKLFAKVAT